MILFDVVIRFLETVGKKDLNLLFITFILVVIFLGLESIRYIINPKIKVKRKKKKFKIFSCEYPSDLVFECFELGTNCLENTIIIESPLHKISKIVSEEFEGLPEGHILLNVNKKMKVGVLEEAEVHIAKSLSQIQEKVANCHLITNTGTKIKVSPKMKVLLTGDNFKIERLTESVQAVINGHVTTWRWSIKPQKRGIQKLSLTVYVIIEIPRFNDRDYCFITKKEDIEVKINLMHYLDDYPDRVIAIVTLIVTIIFGIFTIISNK